jgi:hypothetical protein
VDARPVVLVPTGEVKKPDPKDTKPKAKNLKDVTTLKDAASLKDGTATGHKLGESDSSALDDDKKVTPQVVIFANGDLSSFEITVVREGGIRSVTLSQDDKGLFVAKPMMESKT